MKPCKAKRWWRSPLQLAVCETSWQISFSTTAQTVPVASAELDWGVCVCSDQSVCDLHGITNSHFKDSSSGPITFWKNLQNPNIGFKMTRFTLHTFRNNTLSNWSRFFRFYSLYCIFTNGIIHFIYITHLQTNTKL